MMYFWGYATSTSSTDKTSAPPLSTIELHRLHQQENLKLYLCYNQDIMFNQPSKSVFRPIAPIPRGSRSVQKSQDPARRPVIAACESCRKRKIKCDGIRPACSPCTSSGRTCQYATQPEESRSSALRRSKAHAEQQLQEIHRTHDALLQLVYALISYDNADATTILHQLRQGADPTVIVQNIDKMLQRGQAAGATRQNLAGHTQHILDQRIAGELPPIAQWYSEDSDAYEELYRHLRFATQEEGIEIIRRIQQGQDISDILRLVKDGNLR